MTPEQAPEVTEIQHQQVGDIPEKQALSHPLQVHFTEAAKIKKDQARVLQDSLQSGDIVVGNTPEPDIIAGRRWEADKFRGVKKGLEQVIGQGGIAVGGSFIHSLT